MSRGRPAVPGATEPNPLIETIEPGTPLWRVYPRVRGPLGFNATPAAGRFRPVLDSRGAVVPTAYVALDVETALAEGLLRGVSGLRGSAARRRLYRIELDDLNVVALRVRKPVRVVRLHGAGLARLGALREHLIDTPESEYDYTARWAKALHGARARPHGLCWTSRQNDCGRAMVLWQPRMPADALEVKAPAIALEGASGLELVRTLCADAGVDFEG